MFFPENAVRLKNKQPFTIKTARAGLVSSILCVCILMCGCAAHYYRITDPLTGKTYYSDNIKKIEGDDIQLRDGKTGETVIIQNSEVREINKYEYDSARLHSGQTGTAGSGSSSYQFSRFDRFKDPIGVIKAYRMVDCLLMLAGSPASDDPEGAAVLRQVKEYSADDPDIRVLLLSPSATGTSTRFNGWRP